MKKVIILGGGPAGYTAALKLAGKGLDVTVVEEAKLGGTCLNVGCIPTKAILHEAKIAQEVKKAAGDTFLMQGSLKPQWKNILKKKEQAVNKLVGGVSFLLKKSGIKVVEGKGKVTKKGSVTVNDKTLPYDILLIATGSSVSIPPIKGLKEAKAVIDSSQALSLEELPEKIAIIGGGVIGLEFASAFHSLGAQVVVFEAMPQLIPNFDKDVADALKKALLAEGVEIHTQASVQEIADKGKRAVVTAKTEEGRKQVEVDKVLVAVGRHANLNDIGLDELGVKTSKQGIIVNEYMQTNVNNVYAIGDVTTNIMLAHAAYSMAEVAASHITGGKLRYSEKAIPSCIYTLPELASVGLTERECKEEGIEVQVVKSPLAGNGMSLIETEGQGFIKIILGRKYHQIVGVQVLGKYASEIIAQGVQAIMSEQTAEEFLSFVYPHPSVSEALREAVLESFGEAIHQVRKSS